MATVRKIIPSKMLLLKKKRVAAYARVSSAKDAMLHSLSAQISYYNEYIQKHAEWEYVGVYTDEALTGTKDNRPEFQRLLVDCRDGKVDMIITKSISRFARNTVTLLSTIRELKSINVGVFFEKEGLYSDKGEGEMILTILASCAQEESRATSDNCKWRVRNGFKEGKPHNTTMLGYRYKDGILVIHPQEAEIVRSIFSDFLAGMGRTQIMRRLNEDEKTTRFGGTWVRNAVDKILRNEAYTGELFLQKTFISDYLTKRTCKNNGELPMYRVENAHDAIIDKETFIAVQEEIDRRAHQNKPVKAPESYPFSGIITCSNCGKHYRHKVTPSGAVWICTTLYQHGKASCVSKQIPEDTLMSLAADILMLDEFDEAIFKKHISTIQIHNLNKVTFIFRDGHEVIAEWHDRSRRESWTEEKRQQARERTMQQGRDELWQ
ncbi:MAG: recombinase family protein [Eubacteriales bacterium]